MQAWSGVIGLRAVVETDLAPSSADANFELMKEELGSCNYEALMNNKNAEECYMILKDKIATATDHHIPRK
ncbi:hypothetical protein FHG87_010719 [Trinorchestia longiramus]|nr:hypothetical protein FHG87_010719 [Trinorchestia longiramus]